MDILFNIIGLIGMACFLLAYFLLQKGTCQGDSYGYLLLNFMGSALLIISLYWDWNFAAFALEAAWFAISLWGLHRRYRKDRLTA